MTWKQSAKVPGAERAQRAHAAGGTWYLRSVYALQAVREGTGEPLWTVEIDPTVKPVGSSALAVESGTVATVEDFGSGRPARVRGVDAGSGEERWSRELPLRLSNHSVAAFDGAFHVHGGGEGGDGVLYRLGAGDGEPGDPAQVPAGNGVLAAAGRLWVMGGDGVYVLDEGGTEPRKAADVRPRVLAAGGDVVYVLENTPATPAVVLLDAESGREEARFSGMASASFATLLAPLPRPGHVVVGGSQGAEIVDVRGGKVVAPIELPAGQGPASIAATPHGIAVLAGPLGRAQQAAVFDPETGKQVQELAAGEVIAGALFFGDGRIAVSGARLTFFEWSDG